MRLERSARKARRVRLEPLVRKAWWVRLERLVQKVRQVPRDQPVFQVQSARWVQLARRALPAQSDPQDRRECQEFRAYREPRVRQVFKVWPA